MGFISISNSKINLKGDIVATVTKIGDLDAGTSDNGDWRKKVITILDASCSESMTAWNDDIEKFKLNHKYEITGIYWKDHNGKLYLNFGRYSKVKDLGILTEPNQSKIDDTIDETKAPSSEQYLKDKQKEIEENYLQIPEINKIVGEKVERDIILISQIERKVKSCLDIDCNPAKIGLYIKLIFEKGELLK